MSVYLIAQGKVQDEAKLAQYLKAAGPTLPPEAKILVMSLEPEVMEGEAPLPRTVVIEFPDRAAAMAWYQSPAYQAALPLRLESAPGNAILVEGLGR